MAKQSDLKKDADQILQGIRIVLPGTQALMGFQFIAIFNGVFQQLPTSLKQLHFVTLLFTILCTLLLIAPVAFQQIGEEGSATRQFLLFTRKMLAAAMAFLLLSVTGEVYIASRLIDIPEPWSVVTSAAVFLSGSFLWFLYSVLYRQKD